ncbi:hypothetical protein BKA57DRAFT_190981 [Linnemannia elongata]|nr:hypothetical protein BKA57DRAFT_190981 [Linnemannia elongata]
MSKRPLAESERERLKSKRLTPENAEKSMNEVFAAMLTEKVFSLRPTRLEACGVQYIAEMRLNPRPNVEGYLAHVQTTHPRAKDKFGTVWNRLKEFFSSNDDTTYSDIEEMANVQALVEAFRAERYIQPDEPIQPESNTAPAPAISDPSTASAPTTRSGASISTASSGSSNNSTLSAGAIMRMKIEFDQNFTAWQGEAWKLPSGACVDDIVAEYVRTLNKESALHSFVIDLPTIIIDLSSDPEDKAALTEVLVKREGERAKLVSSTEEAYFRLYDYEPAKVKEILSQGWQSACETEDEVPEEVFRESIHLALHRIYVVYRSNHFKLPEEASESFLPPNTLGFF